MTSPIKARATRAAAFCAALVFFGLVYACIVSQTGVSVPCPFHLATGLLCPGCGVTRMCLALLDFDFARAAAANRFLFYSSPAFAYIIVRQMAAWIRTGKSCTSPPFKAAVIAHCAAALIWGILRNLFSI